MYGIPPLLGNLASQVPRLATPCYLLSFPIVHPGGTNRRHNVLTYRQTDFCLFVLKTWTSEGEFFVFGSCDYNTFSFYIFRMWWECKKLLQRLSKWFFRLWAKILFRIVWAKSSCKDLTVEIWNSRLKNARVNYRKLKRRNLKLCNKG